MKNFKFSGIVLFILLAAFAFTGCDNSVDINPFEGTWNWNYTGGSTIAEIRGNIITIPDEYAIWEISWDSTYFNVYVITGTLSYIVTYEYEIRDNGNTIILTFNRNLSSHGAVSSVYSMTRR